MITQINRVVQGSLRAVVFGTALWLAAGCAVDVGCQNDDECGTCQQCSFGKCLPQPAETLCDDGHWCSDGDYCDGAGQCIVATANRCDDGLFCTGEEDCDEENDICVAGTEPDCLAFDDACSTGVCDAKIDACTKQPVNEGESCDDSNPLTSNERCHAGACSCEPSCSGRECGDDGCGGSCGECFEYEVCGPSGTCECEHPSVIDPSSLSGWQEGCAVPCLPEGESLIGFDDSSCGFCAPRIQLDACKTEGWIPCATYVLAADLTEIAGDCFVIDEDAVTLDGAGHALVSAKRKDVPLVGALDDGGARVLTVLLNNTSGIGDAWIPSAWTFGDISNCSHMCSYEPITLVDVDADGDLDLFMRGQSPDGIHGNTSAIFENKQLGQFGNEPALAIPLAGMGYGLARFVDFDQEGHLDFFIIHDGMSEKYFRGNGTAGGFAEEYSRDLGWYTHDAQLGDFDGDGWIDVMTSSRQFYGNPDTDAAVYVVLNRLQPNNEPPSAFDVGWTSNGLPDGGSWKGFVADFDGDGADDLVTQKWDCPEGPCPATYVRLGNGTGTQFSDPPAFQLEGALAVSVLDADNDGDSDLILLRQDTEGFGGVLLVYINAGRFGENWLGLTLAQEIEFVDHATDWVLGVFYVFAADLNGDDFADLAIGSGFQVPLQIFVNDGHGSFTSRWSDDQEISSSAAGLAWKDLDNDGDLDVMVPSTSPSGNPPTQTLRFLQNDGTGTFAEAWSMTVASEHSYSVGAAGDLDAPPATGIVVRGDNVTVLNFATIRGFTVGVEVTGNDATIEEIMIESPDIYAVRVDGGSGGRIEKVRTRHLQAGTGLALFDTTDFQVWNSSFCESGRRQSDTVIGAYCIGAENLRGGGNRFQLNNGCVGDQFASQRCP